MTVVIVAPGQGSQTPGFLTPWLEDEAFAARLAELSEAAGLDLAEHGTVSDADTIRDTAIAQPLIVAAALASLGSVLAGGRNAALAGIAGHSVGELAAAAAAGILSEADAMRLVRERGTAMADAAAQVETGMSAVLRYADEAELLEGLAALELEAANFNGGGQIVAAGETAALARLAAAPPSGARVIPLQVAGAFHTRFMAPAVAHLREVASSMTVADPTIRIWTNRDGSLVASGTEFVDLMVGQVASPVRWDRVMESFVAAGVTGIIELAPAGALTGMVKRAFPASPRSPSRRRTIWPPRTRCSTRLFSITTWRRPRHDHFKQASGAEFTRIYSYGAARGDLTIPNDDLVAAIDSSDEWIRQRTGIQTRMRASHDVQALDLATDASREAIEASGVAASDIDLVLVATISNERRTPSMSAVVADRVGANPAPSYDLNAACAGFTYAVAQADALIRAGAAHYALVVGAEKLSEFVDPTDRSISFLLADGAGAVVIGPSDEPGISPTVWGSDGSKADLVGMNALLTEYRDGEKPWPTLWQEGPSVYRWAVWEMVKVAKRALGAAGIEVSDLAAFVPHQANLRIVDEFAKQLGLPDTVIIADDITTTGNTSAASIPLATHRLLQEHPELSGGLSLQIGFGAGLVYGAQVVRLP